MQAVHRAATAPANTRSRGGWRGRGGSWRGESAPASAASMATGEEDGEEGEPHTEEGEPHLQLSAAAESSSQRGGRGGRGGRGRGGSLRAIQMPEWKQRLKEAGLCFNCRQAGHQAHNCSNPPAFNPQQSKEKAGQ